METRTRRSSRDDRCGHRFRAAELPQVVGGARPPRQGLRGPAVYAARMGCRDSSTTGITVVPVHKTVDSGPSGEVGVCLMRGIRGLRSGSADTSCGRNCRASEGPSTAHSRWARRRGGAPVVSGGLVIASLLVLSLFATSCAGDPFDRLEVGDCVEGTIAMAGGIEIIDCEDGEMVRADQFRVVGVGTSEQPPQDRGTACIQDDDRMVCFSSIR